MKLKNDSRYIHQLIAQGEHQYQDFKYEISDICKIAKTLSAFANTGGGRLLVGVKDNGKLAGSRTDEETYMIEGAARMYCEPEVDFSIHLFQVEGKNILVMEIQESPLKPVYAKDRAGKRLAYVRIKDENILATPVHLRLWKERGSERGSLITFTEQEQKLLDIVGEYNLLTLNQCCRYVKLPRPVVIRLLAQFIRFEIISMVFKEHRFYYTLLVPGQQGESVSVQSVHQ
ncbi:MAG: ATP-binding protein [Bacteroides sp.]|nr:ATP-binding protein [Bacteroides sp.]